MNRFLMQPLYLQLRDAMVERIAGGKWAPGTMLPNEGDLAREFGVSEGMMRKALDLLEVMRLLTRRPGRGIYVNATSAEQLRSRYNIAQNADDEPLSESVRTGEVTEGYPNEEERALLHLTRNDRVYRFHRRRLHDDRPYMVEDVAMPAAVFPRLANEQDPSHTITELVTRYGILLGKGQERVSIAEASLEVAEALGISRGSSVLVLDRVVFARDGRPVEWRMGWCNLADKLYSPGMN